MDTKMKQFPTNISNPVLSVGMDGTVLYSNEAGGEPCCMSGGALESEKNCLQVSDILRKG